MAIYYDPMFFEHVEVWEARNVPYVAKHETTNFRLFGDFDVVTNEKPENVEDCVTVTPDMLNSWKEKAIQTKMQNRADNREEIEAQRRKDGNVPRIEPEAIPRLTQKHPVDEDKTKSEEAEPPRPATVDVLSADAIIPDETEIPLSSDG